MENSQTYIAKYGEGAWGCIMKPDGTAADVPIDVTNGGTTAFAIPNAREALGEAAADTLGDDEPSFMQKDAIAVFKANCSTRWDLSASFYTFFFLVNVHVYANLLKGIDQPSAIINMLIDIGGGVMRKMTPENCVNCGARAMVMVLEMYKTKMNDGTFERLLRSLRTLKQAPGQTIYQFAAAHTATLELLKTMPGMNFVMSDRERIFTLLELIDQDRFEKFTELRALFKFHEMTWQDFIGMLADHERTQHMTMSLTAAGNTEWVFLAATRPNEPPAGATQKKHTGDKKDTSDMFKKLKAKLSDAIFSARFAAKACLNCGKLDHRMYDCTVATVERAMICQDGEDQEGIDDGSSAAPSEQAALAIAAMTVGPRLLNDVGW
jgi:hypothetical protein